MLLFTAVTTIPQLYHFLKEVNKALASLFEKRLYGQRFHYLGLL